MEKIKLKNGQEFELIPMGISDNVSTKRRIITFKSILTYGEIETQFTAENISKIEHLDEVGETLTAYLDCVGLKALSKNIDDGTYSVELSIDDIERKLSELENNVAFTELALTEIYELMMGGIV